MVITYNRRKQGLEYLRTTLGPLLKSVMERSDLNLELFPVLVYHVPCHSVVPFINHFTFLKIYQGMIGDEEVKTGEKLKVDRNISEEQAMENPKAGSRATPVTCLN